MGIEFDELQLMDISQFEEITINQKFKALRKFWGINEHLIKGTISSIDESYKSNFH